MPVSAGDLYEVVTSPHGVRVIVGDVQGKGLEAVETAAVVLGAFREAAPGEADLAAVGCRLERAVERQLEGEKCATAILAEVRAEAAGRAFLFKERAPETALETVRQDLLQHVNGPLHDDAAVLLLRYR
ncbi:integral membrane protein [Streptomyces azureus]|uniref:Integral membrane protein n=1 Tax=Streptomyces azureus TaxID=146537 RepID=A0A0K8PI17_STRAJ|nr:integral membrane protein [Streptomyces azureus]